MPCFYGGCIGSSIWMGSGLGCGMAAMDNVVSADTIRQQEQDNMLPHVSTSLTPYVLKYRTHSTLHKEFLYFSQSGVNLQRDPCTHQPRSRHPGIQLNKKCHPRTKGTELKKTKQDQFPYVGLYNLPPPSSSSSSYWCYNLVPALAAPTTLFASLGVS